ncbi:MAG: AbrB/MazE/SpoVT family DNA-binding domain-containing protein [Cetobacterium sp.]|uniref:AbrB/MazE/SpoVT family DNA-binding domain-containing protein n=1 Tax=Bacteria TaxID=2 RepID=UPI002FC84822
MKNKLLFKATVTGKRQVTIPKEVYDLLNIEIGNQVVFKEDDGKIVFEVDREYETCFACNGNREIDGNECFICMGNGGISKDLISDPYKFIGMISIYASKYMVKIDYKHEDVLLIKLKSLNYSESSLISIERKIQEIIKQINLR